MLKNRLATLAGRLDSRTSAPVFSFLARHRPTSEAALRRLASDDDDGPLALWLLAQTAKRSDSATSRIMLRSTGHSNALIRAEAARCLAVRPVASAAPSLIHMLRNDPAEDCRVAAAYALGQGGYDGATQALLTGLKRPGETALVRGMILESLGSLGGSDPAVVSAATRGLDDSSPEVVFWAVAALGALGARAALPALRRLVHRSERVGNHGTIGEEAIYAIAVIEGKPGPP